MIHLDVPAHLVCGSKGCANQLSAKLVFNAMGTWNPILPDGHGWQVAPNENGIFLCRCPLHHSKLEMPPGATIGDVLTKAAKH